MKIYTKSGDKGKTSLFSGKRVSKSDARVVAYGTIDELNAHIGLLIEYIQDEKIKEILELSQNKLFHIGSSLASLNSLEENKISSNPKINYDIEKLEKFIDAMENELMPLKNFIIPGGSLKSAQSHICRTVCRRSERKVVELLESYNLDINIIKFLNRLSDMFFVLARLLLKNDNKLDKKWTSNT